MAVMSLAPAYQAGLPARVELAALPTPLTAAPRLAAFLGLGLLHVKRDDLTGFALGGNKARSLEFLIADARQQGADTLVNGGAPASNSCVCAAAAARRAGLFCHLVIAGLPPARTRPAAILPASGERPSPGQERRSAPAWTTGCRPWPPISPRGNRP